MEEQETLATEENPMQEIVLLSHKLPSIVLKDINQRIGDWLASGGEETDPYIEQQLRFARRFISE
ncbi:DUF6877 family protein [Paenibacillus tundrae]|uniref:DUF6877 family protein n=1 Tax=Paenibacillus tundrae TaxID=528187 RepID=UPI0022A8EBEE|nr:DUF6877 family protein [Paenibacillus tundrae]MCZ1267500.1 hypothetical protein [Paenibacillus tundrae]